MSKPLFILSLQCTGEAHCRKCRMLEEGRAFRTAMRASFEVPGDEVDFACPAERGGKPWSYDPPVKSRGLGDTIAKITRAVGIKPCGGCKKRQAALNKLVPYSGDVVKGAGVDAGNAAGS